jgi:hypothetical protein
VAARFASSLVTPCSRAMSAIPSSLMSVSTQPGQMALTVILRGPSSSAAARTRPWTPALLAQYAE